MIERDRELLARAARVNTRLGVAVVELFEHQDGGELPASGVRELGKRLTQLGADFLARAEELDGKPVTHVIIDAQPTWHPVSPSAPDPAR
jgi:hypothetical protein